MKLTKHQWNTGRRYDADGQRMVALIVSDGILFSDLSRHINGMIYTGDYLQGSSPDKYAIESIVMANYDFSNYSHSDTTLTWDESK